MIAQDKEQGVFITTESYGYGYSLARSVITTESYGYGWVCGLYIGIYSLWHIEHAY